MNIIINIDFHKNILLDYLVYFGNRCEYKRLSMIVYWGQINLWK